MHASLRSYSRDVTVVVTAMTYEETIFIRETVKAVADDSATAQIILCIEDSNDWIERALGNLIEDPRLEVLRLKMALPGSIRNQALAYVRMPWIAYCDGDDIWEPDKTVIQRALADETGADFVGADHYIANEDGKVCAFALARHLPITSSWLVRTAVMVQYPFDNTLRVAEDGDWWIRTHRRVLKVRCPKMLLRYRVRARSASSGTPSKERKALIVRLSRNRVMRQFVLLLTWSIWFFSRRKHYLWLSQWDNASHRVEAVYTEKV
ncbi:MAG: family 2 glycosyl transferase [Phormidesmis priestleyi]|uniref:Family 2 glycosyl transferase n=1 Tax=Phormidesmis priestleyi TaxID=268141 RepID=A0A2W4X7G4_9CYAN|nr:MAG: family 2 glycosyl transferase [Phormidesmis priestleyi]